MLSRQFSDSASSTYTCLLASASGCEAVVLDPVKEQSVQCIEIMTQLKLPTPKLMAVAVPANLACGVGA